MDNNNNNNNSLKNNDNNDLYLPTEDTHTPLDLNENNNTQEKFINNKNDNDNDNDNNNDTNSDEADDYDEDKIAQDKFKATRIELDKLTPYEKTEKSGASLWVRAFSPIKEGSLRGGIITFMSMTYGEGVLAVPFAIKLLGALLGLFVFLTFCFLSWWSHYILLISGLKKKILDYPELTRVVLGEGVAKTYTLVNMFLCLQVIWSFQVMIVKFTMTIINTFTTIPTDDVFFWKCIIILVCFLCIQLPFCIFIKKISNIQYLAIGGTIVTIYVLLVILIEMFFYIKENKDFSKDLVLVQPPSLNYFKAMGSFMFIFGTQNGIFEILSETKTPNLRRSSKILTRAISFETVICGLYGFGGYLSTLSKTSDIFIDRYDLAYFHGKDWFNKIGTVLLIVCLYSIMVLYFSIFRSSLQSLVNNNKPLPFVKDALMTLGFFIIVNLLSIFLDSVSNIIGLIAGLTIVIISFIIPINIYIRCNDYPKYHWKNVTSFGVMCIMIVIGLGSAGTSLYYFIVGKSE